jgi:thiol-disulfide isomerase/thioredoxin
MRPVLAAAFFFGAVVMPAAEVARPAPPLSFTTPAGKTMNVSDFKGKVLAVEIMSTTCPHCQEGARILSKLYTELGKKGFQPVGVAINDNPDVPSFIRTYGVNFPVGTGARDQALAFLEHSMMKPFYFPQLVFVDRNGVIRAQYAGTDSFLQTNEEANIRKMVEKLLSEGAAKPAAGAAKSRKKAS